MNQKFQPDFIIFAVTIVLLGIGAVMIFSASGPMAEARFGSSTFFFTRHIARVLLGLILMVILTAIDYHVWRKLSLPILGVTGVMLICLLIPGFPLAAGPINGANRWLHIGPLTLQPSEMVKLAVMIYLANSLAKRHTYIDNFYRGFLPPFCVLCGLCGIILLEKSFGVASTLFMMGIALLFVGRAKVKHLAIIGAAALPAMALSLVLEPYRVVRFMNFLKPGHDIQGSGYQLWQSQISLGSGGLWGLGLGQGRQKLLYLPEAFTDFIFSIIGEEMGFIGTMAVLILFCLLFWRGLRAARSAPDLFGMYLAFGISFMIFSLGLIHIGVGCGLLPTTGIPLPFISYGGSSTLLNLAAIGILLNISKQPGKLRVDDVEIRQRLKAIYG